MRAWVVVMMAVGLCACDAGQLSTSSALPAEGDPELPPERKPGTGGDPDAVDAASPPAPEDPVAPPTAPPPAVLDAGPPTMVDAAPPAPPEAPATTPPEGQDACGDVRMAEKVYNGTRAPTELPLTPGQILAVGSFNGCTGALIAPRHVLSATHCGHRAGATFCMGEDPDSPDRCVRAARVFENPQADQTVLELERDAAEVMPGVQPIPILTERLDQSWIGRMAEAGGYGRTEYGGFNTRWFTAEPIVSIQGATLTIDGQGRRGVCFGDSGGPVMVLASDGTVRVAGDLSNGDPSCLGRDNFTRTDAFVAWIEGHTGPTQVEGAACGDVTVEGRCQGDTALWCGRGDALESERCETCGWDAAARGYRCLAGPDPCRGYDAAGACDGSIARWCEAGVPKARDCGACEQTCGLLPGVGAGCADDPCAGLDYLGRCNGDVAEWCEEGDFRTEDCGDRGQGCGWIDDRVGYFCR